MRYPALTLLAATPVFAAAFLYLSTHQWMFHPWGMTVAWVAVIIAGTLMWRAVNAEWRFISHD